MSRRRESLAELLIRLPWWVSACLGLVTVVMLKAVLPAMAAGNPVARSIAPAGDMVSLFAVVGFGALAAASALFARKRRRLIERQTSLESLRATSWKDFEFLVAEAYRRQDYAVDYVLGSGADGGVDITLRKGGKTTLVQCKQWRVYKVGAPIVRELLGAITAAGADAGIVITTGAFTRDACDFAAANGITLIDGPGLLSLVQRVQDKAPDTRTALASTEVAELDPPVCPLCSAPMTERIARRGANPGARFWGCVNFPACRGTRQIHD